MNKFMILVSGFIWMVTACLFAYFDHDTFNSFLGRLGFTGILWFIYINVMGYTGLRKN